MSSGNFWSKTGTSTAPKEDDGTPSAWRHLQLCSIESYHFLTFLISVLEYTGGIFMRFPCDNLL